MIYQVLQLRIVQDRLKGMVAMCKHMMNTIVLRFNATLYIPLLKAQKVSELIHPTWHFTLVHNFVEYYSPSLIIPVSTWTHSPISKLPPNTPPSSLIPKQPPIPTYH